MRIEYRNMDGQGDAPHEVYDMPPPQAITQTNAHGQALKFPGDYWDAVTNVPCPVAGCDQIVVWYEAGYVPGYRVCMQHIEDNQFDHESLRHRLQAGGTAEAPTLINYETAKKAGVQHD